MTLNLRKSTIAATCLAITMGASHQIASAENLLVWSDPDRLYAYEAYDAARDDIDLEIVTVANNEVTTKLQLALQSGEGIPDVIWMANLDFAAQLSTRRVNYLMDISGKVSPEAVAEFYPTSLAPCERGDKLLCLRNDVAHFVLWYNKPLMEELGLSVPSTWEEFEAVGVAAAANDSGIISGAIGSAVPLQNMLYSADCQLSVPQENDPDTLNINTSSDNCMKSAELIDRMVAAKALTLQGPFDAPFVEAAVAGKLLMVLGPTWFGEHVIKRRYQFEPGTLGVAIPPKWEGQEAPLTYSWGGGVWGVWKDTEHADAAVDLITFMTTDKGVAQAAVTMPAHLPASEPWGVVINSSGYYANENAFEIMRDAAAFGHPAYGSFRYDTKAAMTKAAISEFTNGASLTSLLPAIQEELTNAAKLARYKVISE